MSVNYRDLFGHSTVSWETMAAGCKRLIKEHPDLRWLKNAYANFAFRARDRDRQKIRRSGSRERSLGCSS